MKQERLLKMILFGLWITGAVPLSTYGQMPFNQKYGTEQDYKRLYFLNLQYTQSWVRSDTATYNRLLWAYDFVHQNSSDGLLYPKKQISQLFGQPRFNSIEYFYPDQVIIQFISPDAALVCARPPYLGKGQSVESYSQYNDVYVRRDGQWICVSANVTAITKPGSAPSPYIKTPDYIPLISHLPGSDQDRKTLKELNALLIESETYGKKEQIQKILSDDYRGIGSNGSLYTKQDILEGLDRSAIPGTIENYTIENNNIRFVVKDIAMVHFVLVSVFKDGLTTGTQCNTIFIRRFNQWTCISGNFTPIKN